MSHFKPNEQQEQAISCLRGDVVVAAGAGSGKTAVLAHRFARAVGGDDSDELVASMDGVLTITFTRKAAAELGERIRRVLMERGESGVAQARKVDEGWISTIDSFCSRVVRRHVLELGLDPAIHYNGDVRAAQLRHDTAQAVVGEWMGTHGTSGVARYGTSTLAESLVQDYEKLRAMGRGPADIEVAPGIDPRGATEDLSRACLELASAIEGLGQPSNKTRDANLTAAQTAVALCEAHHGSLDEGEALLLLEGLAPLKFSLAAKPKEEAAAAREALSALRHSLGDVVLAPFGQQYRELLERYGLEYARAKGASGAMDFADAVEGVARLYADRRDIADRYRDQFKLIMIDEFQDTNELQMGAIRPIRDGNLCVVGDVQQSIYGFRYADVSVMRSFESETDTVLPLTANYRTHPDVLGPINHIFSQDALMGDRFVPLEARRTHEYGVPWSASAPRVEAHVLDETMCATGTHASEEAEIVAARLGQLLEAGTAPEDIVILLRAMTHAPKYAAALERAGIPAYLASGEAFFETPEVADVRSLLAVVSMPHDDEAMVGILAGPLGGLNDDALLAVSEVRGKGESLWDGLQAIASGAKEASRETATDAKAVCTRLTTLRELEGSLPLADLVHHAVHLFDYDLVLLASGHRGMQAWSNVNKLVRMAAAYERSEGRDTGAFLKHLEDHERLVAREPVALLASGGGAVRIMSIHAAKGLEFPVVVLPGLGSGLASAARGRILVERDTQGVPQLAMRWPGDGSALESVTHSTFESLKDDRKQLDVDEEKRILYVAMTRAEEVLILVGQADPRKTKDTAMGLLARALGFGPEDESVSADGIQVAVEWHVPSCTGPRIDVEAFSADGREPVAAWSQVDPVLDEATKIICLPQGARTVPSHLSYTSMHMFDECPFRFYARYVLGLPQGVEPKSTSLGVGTAVHLALQNDDPASSIERAAVQVGLDEAQVPRVKRAVTDYLSSGLAKRLDDSERVFHERPFTVPLGPTRLQGQIDVVGHAGTSALIVDYKTGEDEEASLSAERMEGYELQASCYALAALESQATDVEVTFVFVEQGCREVTFGYGEQDAERIREALMERVERMEDEEYPWLERRDERLCSDCAALGLCPHASRKRCLS